MELAVVTMSKIVEMFIIMVIGVISLKAGITDHETGKRLSAILLKVISPCLLIMSYQIEFKTELLRGLLLMVGLSILSHLAAIAVTRVCIRQNGNPNAAVEKMAVVYSNCGFIGIPLANILLGSEGVFYITAYIMVYNLFVWSHGLLLMTGRASSIKATLKNFIQPATVAMAMSLALFIGRIHLPEIIGNPLDMVGDMNTAVAMLVSGINLAESDILGCLRRKRTYLITFLKLTVVPLLTILIVMLIKPTHIIALTVMIAAACPTGATGTMFALQYHKDSNYASELFTITTILSLITIPIMIFIGGFVL